MFQNPLKSLIPNLVLQLKKNDPNLSMEEARDWILEINELDPTGEEANYTPWILKQILSGEIDIDEDREEVYNLLRLYDLNKRKKQLFGGRTLYDFDYEELSDVIEELYEQGLLRTKSKKESKYPELNIEGMEGVEEVYNDGVYRVFRIDEVEPVMLSGKGTAWCTRKREYAEDYLEHGPIFRIYKNNRAYASLNVYGLKNVRDYDMDLRKNKELNKVLYEVVKNEKDPALMYNYADANHKRFREFEPYIMKDPDSASNYAIEILKRRWPAAEKYIVKSPDGAYLYSWLILKRRWPAAEKYIMKDPEYSSHYAINVIKGRWPEAEHRIMKSPEGACEYARVILKKRWPAAEKYIMEDPEYAAYYAKDVMKKRWPAAEKYIKEDEEIWNEYKKHFKIKRRNPWQA